MGHAAKERGDDAVKRKEFQDKSPERDAQSDELLSF